MKMKFAWHVSFATSVFALHAGATTLLFRGALRGNAKPVSDKVVHVAPQAGHTLTHPDTVTSQMKATKNGTFAMTQAKVPPGVYSACKINPNSCQVNANQVSADLGSRVVLLFGCSIDIYALDYFCKSAGAQVVGFTRGPNDGGVFAAGNLAYCSIGGTTLAYSFQPGVSGPPYSGHCNEILKRDCSKVQSAQLVQDSVNAIVTKFGQPPTAVVVDSSLWDVTSWWRLDGRPPEPYVAPLHRLHRWCQQDFPALLHAVHMAIPNGKVAFRNAPPIDFAPGYGHSMQNINTMNECLATSRINGNMRWYPQFDYHHIVESVLSQYNVSAASVYYDAYHPGVIPSVFYIDSVLQWAKGLPIGR